MSQPVLLIHGFVCDSRFWEPQISALQRAGYAVAAPDLPYHGGPTEGVEASLAGLAEWVATACHGPTALVGHSLGGMIALQVAHRCPDLVAGIALVDSFPALERNGRYLPDMFVAGSSDPTRAWIERTRASILRDMTPAVHDRIWPSIAAFDATPWLGEITCPLLGVYGGRGQYVECDAPRLRGELLLDRAGGSVEVVVIPASGHFVGLEAPARTNAALLGWLARVTG